MYLFISDNTTDTKGLRYQLREGDLKKQNKTKKHLVQKNQYLQTPETMKTAAKNTRTLISIDYIVLEGDITEKYIYICWVVIRAMKKNKAKNGNKE